MMNSQIVTLELEVEVSWDENSDGDKEYVSSECHTKAPIAVASWAQHQAWDQLRKGQI